MSRRLCEESTVVCRVVCRVDGRAKNRGMEGGEENTLRGCFVEEGIVVNGEVGRKPGRLRLCNCLFLFPQTAYRSVEYIYYPIVYYIVVAEHSCKDAFSISFSTVLHLTVVFSVRNIALGRLCRR